MRDPGWSPPPCTPPPPRPAAHRQGGATQAANPPPPASLLSHTPAKGKARAIDPATPVDADSERRARRRARPRPSRAPSSMDDVNPSRLTSASDRPRSVSRRRYRLPSPPPAQEGFDACCCCDGDAEGDLFEGGDSSAAERQSAGGPPAKDDGSGGKGEWRRDSGSSEGGESSLGSSTQSFAPSLSPSSSRTRLFDSDDEDYDESPRWFSPVTPSSFTSSLQRKTSISKAATSDPLLSPSSSASQAAPTFSGGKGSPRHGRWVPAPSEATSLECTSAPELPDVVQATVAPSPPASPPRSATSPSPRPSLLTKSLRSLSRLPNLTLPDLLPRLPTPDTYLSSARPTPSAPAPELATLPPGWGPAERRRVLAAEPSHAADEARGFVLSLSLRRASSSSRKGFPPAAPTAALAIVDEVEAAAVAPLGMSMCGMSLSAAQAAAATGAQAHDASLSPTDDIPPLVPAVSPAAAPAPLSPVPAVVEDAAGEPAPPPVAAAQPATRYISNPRHLLQLAIEFEMMRHAKIRGPLRQRAVIVRQATSPPRYGSGGRAHERSRLCEEVEG
ncbi:hypothetical protein JCM9279_000626 [Rhodotorula babjevae]